MIFTMFHGRSPISAQRSCRTTQRHQAKSSWQKWKCTTLKSPTSGANFWLVIKHQWIEKLKNYQKLLSLTSFIQKKNLIDLWTFPQIKTREIPHVRHLGPAKVLMLHDSQIHLTFSAAVFFASIRRRKKKRTGSVPNSFPFWTFHEILVGFCQKAHCLAWALKSSDKNYFKRKKVSVRWNETKNLIRCKIIQCSI